MTHLQFNLSHSSVTDFSNLIVCVMSLFYDYEATEDTPGLPFLLMYNNMVLTKIMLYHIMIKLDYLACVFTIRVLWLIYCVIILLTEVYSCTSEMCPYIFNTHHYNMG